MRVPAPNCKCSVRKQHRTTEIVSTFDWESIQSIPGESLAEESKENTRNNLLLGSATSEGTESAQTLLWPKGQYVGHKEPGTFDKTEKGKAVTIGRCSSSTKLRGRRK